MCGRYVLLVFLMVVSGFISVKIESLQIYPFQATWINIWIDIGTYIMLMHVFAV